MKNGIHNNTFIVLKKFPERVREFDRLLADKRNHRMYALIEKSRIYK